MKYHIELRDERDKDSVEPWSYWAVCYDQTELTEAIDNLMDYLKNYPQVTEFRVRIEQ